MFSVNAKPTPTMPAYTMPSRTPSSSGAPPPQQEQQEQALAGLLGHRRADLEHPVVGDAADEAADALEQQRDRGGDEDAPQQTAGEQAARLGLVAVEPQEAGDQRTRPARRPAARPGRSPGARRTAPTTSVIGTAHEEHQRRHHDREDGAARGGHRPCRKPSEAATSASRAARGAGVGCRA